MDLDTLFQVLTGADKAAQADNPYSGLLSTSKGIGDIIVKNAPNYSLKDVLLSSLASGVASGLLSRGSESYTAKQNALASDLLFQSISGGDIKKPSDMSPSVFNTIDAGTKLFKKQQELEKALEIRKVQQSIAQTRFGNPLYEPIGSTGGENSVKATYGPSGELNVQYGAPGAEASGATEGSTLQNIVYKVQNQIPLTEEEQITRASAPPKIQELLSKAEMMQGLDRRSGANLGFRKQTALGGQFAKAGRLFDTLPAIKEAKQMLGGAGRIESLVSGDVTNIDVGILKSQVARAIAGEKGVLTNQDVERNLPATMAGQATGLYNFLSGRTSGTLTAPQIDALLALAANVRQEALQKIELGKNEVRQRTSKEAPLLFSSIDGAAQFDEYLQGLATSDTGELTAATQIPSSASQIVPGETPPTAPPGYKLIGKNPTTGKWQISPIR